MAAIINISAAVLPEYELFKTRITGPGKGIEGNARASESMIDLFAKEPGAKEGSKVLEAELLSFTCNSKPTVRVKMVGAEKNVPQTQDTFQWRGKAVIRIGNVESEVNMHVSTAAMFSGKKMQLQGTVGEITSGQRAGSRWLAFSALEDTPPETLDAFVRQNIVVETKL